MSSSVFLSKRIVMFQEYIYICVCVCVCIFISFFISLRLHVRDTGNVLCFFFDLALFHRLRLTTHSTFSVAAAFLHIATIYCSHLFGLGADKPPIHPPLTSSTTDPFPGSRPLFSSIEDFPLEFQSYELFALVRFFFSIFLFEQRLLRIIKFRFFISTIEFERFSHLPDYIQ